MGREGREKHTGIHGINISRSLQDPFNGMFRFAWSIQAAPRGGNWGHYASPAMDALINKALATFDDAARLPMLRQVNELMNEDALMLWVVHDLNPRAMSPRVRGFVQAQSWFQDLTPITIAPR
jgi:peptide/nickel transport system substrate-binding protein